MARIFSVDGTFHTAKNPDALARRLYGRAYWTIPDRTGKVSHVWQGGLPRTDLPLIVETD